jgi:subtilisin family serine protease
MSKLDARLQRRLADWRRELEQARRSDEGARDPAEIESQSMVVIVTYTGGVEALRAAGLQTGFDRGGVVSGLIALRDVERLDELNNVVSIALEPPTRILLDTTVAEMRVPWKTPPATAWPGQGAGVIVAVIDTGIDIFHDSFRKSDGTTRILELWDQGITVAGHSPPPGLTPIGAVFTAADINASLSNGPVFPSTDTNGHGTHVAGIAAGNGRQDDRCTFPGRYIGVAPEADLIIVRAIAIPSPGQSSISDALQWCATASARHGNKPVVINCSFGSDIGPHDGTGTMDGFIDAILRPAGGPPQGLAIVVAAGNAGELELHETGTVPANGTATVSFTMPDGSEKGDTLDIWYNGTSTLNIEIISPPNPALPGPITTGPIPPGAPGSPFAIGLQTIAVSSSTAPLAANNNRKQIQVSFSTPANRALRSGPWQIKFTETAGVQATWDAWFASSHEDPFPTFRLLTDNAATPRRRMNTIDEPGTSRNAITIASYHDDGGELADSSSRGPQPVPGSPVGEVKPTVAAPGVKVKAPRSRNDPDVPSSCCDQRHIDKSGTSMASPHVCGLVALIFEKNRTLTFEQVRAHLQKAARIDGIPAADVPPVFDAVMNIRAGPLWGSGKVDATQTLADIPAGP